MPANSQKSSPGGTISKGSRYSPVQRNASPMEPESTQYRHSPVPLNQPTTVKVIFFLVYYNHLLLICI